ncbi:MAG: DUF1540 domain-containing protein [Clostridia bacterium]|nr:DUF1540 domain-containing protein [Clostridia bacterium]MDD4387300.1 DUF1540 domain-containing protein [Clostridia bacterium]
MSYHQKIQCTVTECAHNCLEDSTCRLDKILVSHGLTRSDESSKDDTACGMFLFVGKSNAEETRASKQV